MSNPRKKLKLGLGMAVAVLLIVYSLFQAKDLIRGPIIVIAEPLDGVTLSQNIVKISGSAKNIAYINLNDRQIFVDSNGIFSETIIAPSGYSVVKLSARDKFGETEEQTIRMYLREESPPLPTIVPEEITDTEEETLLENVDTSNL